ncbi:MAG: PAS domain-containing protein [Alphaproteobacteria bacterium]|nr:PAS domain-containing protein [Alphaproteobacteria bacterium]
MAPDLPLNGQNRLVFEYWNAKRGERLVPALSEIDFLDFEPKVVEWLQMIDRLGPEELYVRFFGPAYVQLMGRESTGKNPYGLYQGRRRELVVDFMNRLYDEPAVGLSLDERTTPRGAKFALEFVHMPLMDAQDRVASILTSGAVVALPAAGPIDPGGDFRTTRWQRAHLYRLPTFECMDYAPDRSKRAARAVGD